MVIVVWGCGMVVIVWWLLCDGCFMVVVVWWLLCGGFYVMVVG